jgi:hypothetical protein
LTDSGNQLTEPTKVWPSVGEVAPIEEGGPNARKGFNYQDEIAVGFLIAMLEDETLLRVQCETHDDLVLIWAVAREGNEEAEYVQVKGSEQDKYWSVADLCAKKTKTTPSIYEASLARDRHSEPAKFRIVTLRPVTEALVPLTFPCGSDARTLAEDKIAELRASLDGKFPGAKSPKGNDCQYWIDHCGWDVRNDITTARHDNLRRLLLLSNAAGVLLVGEQLELLLEELRSWAKAAGDAKWVPDRAKKIISQAQIRSWWTTRLAEFADARGASAGGQLAAKMKAAGLPDEMISLAIDLRRGYAAEVRVPRYMESDRAEQLQNRVKSEAMSLRASLIAGDLHLSGPAFHATCVKRMDDLSETALGEDVSAFLKGCLYDIADRCLLRFEQPPS